MKSAASGCCFFPVFSRTFLRFVFFCSFSSFILHFEISEPLNNEQRTFPFIFLLPFFPFFFSLFFLFHLQAEELKQLGNKAFSAGDHDTAIKHFTDAIALDPSNHVLFSNRSVSFFLFFLFFPFFLPFLFFFLFDYNPSLCFSRLLIAR